MKDKRKILELLNQIIEYSQDEDHQKKMDPETPLEQKTGKSWTVFHLEQLRTLIESEEKS